MVDERDGLREVFDLVERPLRADMRDVAWIAGLCFALALASLVTLFAMTLRSAIESFLLSASGVLAANGMGMLVLFRIRRRQLACATGEWALLRGKPRAECERVLRELLTAARSGKENAG